MKASKRLAGWLADPAARNATQDRIRAVRAGWRQAGPLAAFEARLGAIAVGDPAVIAAATQAALDALFAGSDWLAGLIAEMVADCAADPFFEPPLRSLGTGLQTGLMLVDHPLAAVSLRCAPAAMVAAGKQASGPRSITFTGVATLLRICRGTGARIAFYEADPVLDDFQAVAAPPCRLVERRVFDESAIIAVDGRTQSFVIEAAPTDLLVLMGEARALTAPLAREYDADTLGLIGVSATDEIDSRIQLMLSLLRLQRRTDAGDCFAALIVDAPFYLRWSAMREWLATDPAGAIPLLEQLADSDPHPEVRAAAVTTRLRLLESHPGLVTPVPRQEAA